MKKLIIICFASLLIPTWLNAENTDKDEKSSGKERTAWIVTTSIPKGINNPVTLLVGDKYIEVVLSNRRPSEGVRIPADGTIHVLQKSENPDDPEKPSYASLVDVQIDEGIQNALVILSPDSKESDKPILQAKIQDLATFKNGEWLFINTTKFDVSVEVDNEKLLIEPDKTKIWKAEALGTTTKISMSYRPDKREPDTWKLVSSSSIAIYNTRREVCIFSWDANLDRMDYNGITLTTP